ncbi:MAG: UDP-N-acetylglucosamine 2-epimerase (non-hydrolyzing) [Bacteroidota bacterium]
MKKICAVIGARPQFIKHAPFLMEAKGKLEIVSIHTGQHYDANMSDIFFQQLHITQPAYNLAIGSHSHAKQTALMMMELESILMKSRMDGLLVYGDTNSTLAGALVASKMEIPIFHVEAGLRGDNKSLPEEVNRIITDRISDLLFTPTDLASANLKEEGITNGVIQTGDIMYDMVNYASKLDSMFQIPTSAYYYCTTHRPYNVDHKNRLLEVLNALNGLSKKVIIPLHPRTKSSISNHQIDINKFSNIEFVPPQSYLDNISYIKHAEAVITDSGGVQKEAYFLKKKCVTLRSETEWKETLKENWNHLVFDNLNELQTKIDIQPGYYNPSFYGDGTAAEKIVKGIIEFLD